MRALTLLTFVLAAGCPPAATPPNTAAEPAAPAPPVAEQREHVHTEHGVDRSDPYYWLRDREDPAVIAYVQAENAYAEAALAHLEPFRKVLYDEMLGRIQETDLSVPYHDGGYWYYSRTEEGKAYAIYARKQGSLDAEEELVLDMNAVAEGHEYAQLGALSISPDHKLLAYGVDHTGRELFTLRVKDLETGEVLADEIPEVSWGATWAADGETLLYTRMDDALRPYQVLRHTLGTEVSEDAVLFEDLDPQYFVGAWRSGSDAYLFIASSSSLTTEIRMVEADDPNGDWRVISPRHKGMEYWVEHQGDRLLVRTNDCDDEAGNHADCATNFKLMQAPLDGTSRESWTELVPHRDDVTLEGVDAFADWLVLTERDDGLLNYRVWNTDTGEQHAVEMPEVVYETWLEDNEDYEADKLRFGYSSPITPDSVFEWDMGAQALELLKETPVLGGYDRDRYAVERLWATSADGTQVPISVMRLGGVDSPSPTLLYGYGAYGIPLDPWWSSVRLSAVDRGVTYAFCHTRGGGDMGRRWYEDGKFEHKQHTFDDFIACAAHLVAEGYTTPEAQAMVGASAGGLLIGAVLNQRPDLFGVAVAQVPFVDAVTTMLDESIPLTSFEWEEWGDPREKEWFDVMLAYSPYDNVAAKDYPHLLVTSGLNDPRVQYWEPTKWVARLRATKTGDTDLVLHTYMGAGHGGQSGRYGYLQDEAYVYAFILDKLGLAGAPLLTAE